MSVVDRERDRDREPGRPPRVCIFTVHPPRDQRILRQVRTLHEAGYQVMLIDLGPTAECVDTVEMTHRTLPMPKLGMLSRLLATGRIARCALRTPAELYHMHDYYLLPWAVLLRLTRRRPVVYDVHEHYPEYYAGRLPFGRAAGQWVIAAVENAAAAALGHLSVVYPDTADRLSRGGRARVALTQNHPSRRSFQPMRRQPAAEFAARLRRVLYTGTLSAEYGALVLVDIGHEIDRRGLDVSLTVIRRFHRDSHRREFEEYLAERGVPRCLESREPMHPDELGPWLHGFGIGLHTVQPGCGHSWNVVSTKLPEYTLSGLTLVGADLPQIRAFVEETGNGELAPPADAVAYVDAIERIIADPARAQRRAQLAAERTLTTMTWEHSGGPALLSLYDAMSGSRRVPVG
jgi:glycosyltransferase involved in cell wall biosynthesis